MKRTLFVSALLAVALIACSKQEQAAPTPAATAAPAAAPTPAPAPAADAAKPADAAAPTAAAGSATPVEKKPEEKK